MFQTEYEFTLPLGYIDDDGTLHRDGMMRLATAADEILPLRDPRVQQNEAYLIVILLSRVITSLGTVPQINPKVIEGLYAADLAYLQELYNRINRHGTAGAEATCPQCAHSFAVAMNGVGGILGYPLKALYEEVAFVAYHFHWPPEAVLKLEHADRRAGWPRSRRSTSASTKGAPT